jgi:ferredoxin
LQCPACRDCASEELDCFVLDSNGYVVLAEDKNLTGSFFGEVEETVMDSLRTGSVVFKEVPIFDYQALCFTEVTESSNDANFILTVILIFKIYNLEICSHNINWIFVYL